MENEPHGRNRLGKEKSPYLLQHAANPVDWYPWGDEAFERAKREDRPVFLSIGYSTCHWCHVMERESFEDEEAAELMNETFVSIKVDREERPDIDGVYMTAAQAMTGSGGWPLTIIMTPDREPFFAATYLPKRSLMRLTARIGELWKDEREKITESAAAVVAALREPDEPPGEGVGREESEAAYGALAASFDAEHGGFGNAPKFPSPHTLLFLISFAGASGEDRAAEMARKTLLAMASGGIRDHLGGGFHRYSTDRRWLVPHFEKMLYDQALLVYTYAQAYSVTGDPRFADVAGETVGYLLRDMAAPEGAFYSAEDADSEGIEGKFYLWPHREINAVLGPDSGPPFCAYYGIRPDGNFTEQATGNRGGSNILHLGAPFEDVAEEYGKSESELRAAIERGKKLLFDVREERIRPALDDKILTDWNGLTVAALARAGMAADKPAWIEAAKRAVAFLLSSLRSPDGRLLHRYRAGDAGVTPSIDDYAFLVFGLVELYGATFDPEYLERAVEITDIAIGDFWDDENGGFAFTPEDGERLIVRARESHDAAIPSGNSVFARELVRLSRLTGRTEYEERARRILEAFSGRVKRSPAAHAFLLIAAGLIHGGSTEIVVVGNPGGSDTISLLNACRSRNLPGAVILLKDPSDPRIARLAPFVEPFGMVRGNAAAYLCSGFTCELPVTDPEELLALMDRDR